MFSSSKGPGPKTLQPVEEKDPEGGPFPAYPSGKTWDEPSGKTGVGARGRFSVGAEVGVLCVLGAGGWLEVGLSLFSFLGSGKHACECTCL